MSPPVKLLCHFTITCALLVSSFVAAGKPNFTTLAPRDLVGHWKADPVEGDWGEFELSVTSRTKATLILRHNNALQTWEGKIGWIEDLAMLSFKRDSNGVQRKLVIAGYALRDARIAFGYMYLSGEEVGVFNGFPITLTIDPDGVFSPLAE